MLRYGLVGHPIEGIPFDLAMRWIHIVQQSAAMDVKTESRSVPDNCMATSLKIDSYGSYGIKIDPETSSNFLAPLLPPIAADWVPQRLFYFAETAAEFDDFVMASRGKWP